MVDNTEAFYLWLGNFIELFSYHFSRLNILGYSIIDILIGPTILIWLLHKLTLSGNRFENIRARNTPDMMKHRKDFAGKIKK